MAMMRGFMLPSTRMVSSVGGIVILGEVGLVSMLLPTTCLRKYTRQLPSLLQHDGKVSSPVLYFESWCFAARKCTRMVVVVCSRESGSLFRSE